MSTYKCERSKPCSECPFTKRSLPGWLGPYKTVSELHTAGLHEAGYPCHVSQNDILFKRRPFDEAHQCVGALMYASNAFKTYGNPALEAERLRLKDLMDDKVFKNIMEFRNWHTKK